MKNIIVEGHRGYCAKYPENTLISFAAAMDLGVDAFEFDVWLTSDKVPVLMHDGNARRTCGVDRHLRDMTLAEAKQLDACYSEKFGDTFKGQGITVPTLEETLQLAAEKRPDILFGVEIKEYTEETVDLTVALLKKYGVFDRCWFYAFNARIIRYIKEKYNGRTMGYPDIQMGEFQPDSYDWYEEIGLSMMFVRSELCAFYAAKGMPMHMYCADNENDVRLCIARGADLITANDPVPLMRVLGRMRLMSGRFLPTIPQIGDLLASFGIQQIPVSVDELLRYDCTAEELSEKQFRLILKLSFAECRPLVMKFRGGGDERDRRFVIEAQTAFADLLYKHRIPTSQYHRCGPWLTRTFDWNGYHTVVTLEDFCEQPIAAIDEEISYKTGRLLAQMHTVSEENRCHVPNRVIMDVFGENDFFDFSEFEVLGKKMSGVQLQMHSEICRAYAEKAAVLTPLKGRYAYAVQGDMSIDNIYRTEDGGIGVFDFNCSGDNILFCDAVMEAWFLAHNMDYAEPLTEALSDQLAEAYLRGYHEIRPFTDVEKQMIPPLYAIATAFDGRITDRLAQAIEDGNTDEVRCVLDLIYRSLIKYG